jgi:hypothetical protein
MGDIEKEVSDAELDRTIEEGRKGSAIAGDGPRAVRAEYNRDSGRIEVEMDGGWLIAFPPGAAQGLRGASAELLSQVEIVGDGYALHWEELDADFTIPGILAGKLGTRTWMRELARRAGSIRSPAKARAARKNGMKGGRPRKRPSST